MGNGSTAGVARELFLKLGPWGVSSLLRHVNTSGNTNTLLQMKTSAK